MPTTALFFLPTPPNTASPSPLYTSLTTHLTLKHATQSTTRTLSPYTLEHKLFVNTLSLVPTSPSPTQRQYTQFLSAAHIDPGRTFVGSSYPPPASPAPGNNAEVEAQATGTAMAVVTVPTTTGAASGADAFADLLARKMQPLWSARQVVQVDGGLALSLKEGLVTVRVGEVRTFGGTGAGVNAGRVVSQGQGATGQGAGGLTGSVRGVVVELVLEEEFSEDEAGREKGTVEDDREPEKDRQPERKGMGDKMETDAVSDGHTKGSGQPDGQSAASAAKMDENKDDVRWSRRTDLISSLFSALFSGCSGLSRENMRMVCRPAMPTNDLSRGLVNGSVPRPRSKKASEEGKDLVLVRQYMELLRFARA